MIAKGVSKHLEFALIEKNSYKLQLYLFDSTVIFTIIYTCALAMIKSLNE